MLYHTILYYNLLHCIKASGYGQSTVHVRMPGSRASENLESSTSGVHYYYYYYYYYYYDYDYDYDYYYYYYYYYILLPVSANKHAPEENPQTQNLWV